MKDRISSNEEILDKASKVVDELKDSINKLNDIKEDIIKLNKYYGSKNWFKDKEVYESKMIDNKVKAGVLSEDLVWNMNEDLNSTLLELKIIIDSIKEA